jgi:hypothetical protein
MALFAHFYYKHPSLRWQKQVANIFLNTSISVCTKVQFFSYQPSAISGQQSAISYQQSAISYQLSAISFQLTTDLLKADS